MKASAGTIPVFGSFLSELIGTILPNQRVDRIADYVIKLNERLEKIQPDLLDELRDNPEFVDLIEESFFQASRAITDERRNYIATIVANGITNDQIKLIESKYLLRLLQEINDIEVIWLRSYVMDAGQDTFRQKHMNVLHRQNIFASDTLMQQKGGALQDNYVDHLERLGLLERTIKYDRKLDVPKYNRYTHKLDTSSPHITIIGRLLLTQIDLLSPT